MCVPHTHRYEVKYIYIDMYMFTHIFIYTNTHHFITLNMTLFFEDFDIVNFFLKLIYFVYKVNCTKIKIFLTS